MSRLRFLPAVILFACLSSPNVLQAQTNKAAAVALFDEGRAAMSSKDFDVACAKFTESNRIDPAVGTAFNLANCEEQRGRLATAWALFKQVAAKMKPDDPRLSVANERITVLDTRVPRVTFVATSKTPTGTRLRLDDLELDIGSFNTALPLDPGSHQAIVRAPGAAPQMTRFTLAAGESRTLSLDNRDAEASPEPSMQASPGAEPSRIAGLKRSDAVLATAAVGGVGLLVGVIAGAVGLNAQAKGNAECSDRTRSCSQSGYDANQRAKSMAVVSSVGFIIGILGGGAATYLYLTTPSPGDAARTASLGIGGSW